MNNQIQTFFDFLLDTETTSEVSFSQAILKQDELYQARYRSMYERMVDEKLKQWKDFNQKLQNAIADHIATNAESEASDSESESDSEQDLSSGDEKEKPSQFPHLKKEQMPQSVKQPDVYIDPVGQCKRLLQFLHHCQQHYVHFADVYFRTLDRCIKNDNENIGTMALQQIALHLSDDISDQKERQRLIQCLPSNLSSPTIPKVQKRIFATIQTLLSTSKTKQDVTSIISLHDIDILYPYKARFLDLRREFRDSTHYFIDGDSLLLSVAHHANIDLLSYHGNTLHVIYIIERILLTLFNQAHQCNYTLVFFDCNYQLYRKETSILGLLRACLIAHLSKNADRCGSSKVRRFSSWLDHEYTAFASEEKPHFIFYHDMSSFDIEKDPLLSKNALKNLLYIYRLFGNYHQYSLQCHIYLMNKLMLTDTIVKCFQVQFKGQCSMKVLIRSIGMTLSPLDTTISVENDSLEFEKICQGDVRLFLYLQTINNLIEEKKNQSKEQHLLNLLSPLLVLHVSLLIRLSLVDRHLSLTFPSVKFSSMFSELIVQFQQRLALCLSSHSSSLSWSKVVDLFDGRLFAFTLYQLKQSSSKMCFDSNTYDVVKECLIALKLPSSAEMFSEILKELIKSNSITFPSSSSSGKQSTPVRQQKLTRISNPFVDTYLKPILTSNNGLTFDFADPDDIHLDRYEGKYHWHVYKEVGDEFSRIRDNDEENKNYTRYRY